VSGDVVPAVGAMLAAAVGLGHAYQSPGPALPPVVQRPGEAHLFHRVRAARRGGVLPRPRRRHRGVRVDGLAPRA
jgi:hypothetical protein